MARGIYIRTKEMKERRSGVGNPMFGKKHSIEAKQKIRLASKRLWMNKGHKEKISRMMKEYWEKNRDKRILIKEKVPIPQKLKIKKNKELKVRKIPQKICINCKRCGKEMWLQPCYETRKYCSKKCTDLEKIGKKFSIETRKKMSLSLKKAWQSGRKKKSFLSKEKETKRREKISKSSLLRWQNEDYRKKTLKKLIKSLVIRPTSLEKQMMEIIQRHNLPYKYVGDGSFLIGWKNPDFVNINGEKKLIEVGNLFHHQGNYIEERRSHFAQYGWKSFIFIGNKLHEEEILKALLC